MTKPAIPEIDLFADAFDTANPILALEKRNVSLAGAALGALPTASAATYPTAELVNLLDNLARRYQRRLNGLARNVTEYGATGDGSTDDTAALQAAIDVGPGEVFLPPGTYVVTALTKTSSVTLRGVSEAATIIRASGSDLVSYISGNGIRLYPGVGLASLIAAPGVAVELCIDLREMVTASLSTGTLSIGGDTWSVNVNADDTLQTTAAEGIEWEGGANNTRYDTAGQTASSLELPMSTLYTRMGIDASYSLKVEAYISAVGLADNGNAFGIGIRGDSGTPSNVGDRFAGSSISQQSGLRLWRPSWSGSAMNYTTAPADVANVVGVAGNTTSGMKAIAGQWDTDWSSTLMSLGANIGANMGDNEVLDVNNVLALFFSTGSAGDSGATATIEQVRVRAVPS